MSALRICQKENCNEACIPLGKYCQIIELVNMSKKTGVLKVLMSGNFCVSHGGGKRCQKEGCTKVQKSNRFCSAHGGGKNAREGGSNGAQVQQLLYKTWWR